MSVFGSEGNVLESVVIGGREATLENRPIHRANSVEYELHSMKQLCKSLSLDKARRMEAL